MKCPPCQPIFYKDFPSWPHWNLCSNSHFVCLKNEHLLHPYFNMLLITFFQWGIRFDTAVVTSDQLLEFLVELSVFLTFWGAIRDWFYIGYWSVVFCVGQFHVRFFLYRGKEIKIWSLAFLACTNFDWFLLVKCYILKSNFCKYFETGSYLILGYLVQTLV